MYTVHIMSHVSIIIPIHNEEDILETQIVSTLQQLKKTNITAEIILIENGSRDNTYHIAQNLSKRYHSVRVLKLTQAHYGKALQKGILKAQFEHIVQCDLDYIDISFITQAVHLLTSYDIVIGSKIHPESHDERPWHRKLFTLFFNTSIRLIFRYSGDTHGIKAYKKSSIEEISKKIIPSQHLFDTELILRAHHSNKKIIQRPITITELRASRFENRTGQAVRELLTLFSKYHAITKR